MNFIFAKGDYEINLTKYEKETIITFNDAEDTAQCYTCNSAMMNKLDKLCLKSKEICLKKEDAYSKTYTFPKRWVSVKVPPLLTEEERQKRSLRAKERFGKSK